VAVAISVVARVWGVAFVFGLEFVAEALFDQFDELFELEGAFDEDVFYAEAGGAGAEHPVGEAGDQDDGGVLPLGESAEVLEEGDAVDFGHHLVEEDDVGLDVADAVHGVSAVVGAEDFEAGASECLGEELELILRVFDDEYFGHKPFLKFGTL
jgi:hypothetical protein